MGFFSFLKRKPSPKETGFVAELKRPEDVFKRFVLLSCMTELAEATLMTVSGHKQEGTRLQKIALDRLVAMGLGPLDLEPREQELALGIHRGRIDRGELAATTWRAECAGVLVWALGLSDGLPAAQESADPEKWASELPTTDTDYRRLLDNAATRPLHEVLAGRQQLLSQWFELEAHPPNEARSRALERARAIRWLTEPELTELTTTAM